MERTAVTRKGQPSLICAVGLLLTVFSMTTAWFSRAVVIDNLRSAGVKEFPLAISVLFGPLFGVVAVLLSGLFLAGVFAGKRAGGVVGWFGMLLLIAWMALLTFSISLVWRAANGA